jgi:2-dehydro-3-deoxygalactonokinase
VTDAAAAFAAVDWGTTRLRAWLLDAAGEVVAERRSDEGMLALPPDRFGAVLDQHLGAMGASTSLPVIICGMAGSRQGWIEAPYVATPARFTDILAGAVRVADTRRDVRIIPGIAQREPDRPDVLRGEETQLAGIASLHDGADMTVCMPGTHCKWVEVAGGTVIGFTTWLTGELFSVLSQHSILRHALGPQPSKVSHDDPVFRRWLDEGLAHPADALSRLFRIRASTLLFEMQPQEAAAALSGLLIGSEVASARAALGTGGKTILVASGGLGDLYALALGRAGYSATRVDAETAVRNGLLQAARENFALDAGRSPTA